MVFRRRLVSPRPVVFCQSGTSIPLGPREKFDSRIQSRQTRPRPLPNNYPRTQELIESLNSDGIARVHGMTNVQAEELVEYVHSLHILAFSDSAN